MRKRSNQCEGEPETQDLLLERLQGLEEAKLQNDIITPLFQALGYDSVDQHGGPDEHGIDLVCWKKDELDEIELAVAQIKRFKPERKTYSSRGFAYLITQLSQACERRVPHSDGQEYLPRTVYFVTPYALDARTLSARFEKIAALKQVGVKIIDGPKLANLLKKRLPQLVEKLLGHTSNIKKAVANRINNDILLNALNCPSRHPIEGLYIDVDFALGSRGARIFLLSDLSPRTVELHLNETEWYNFLDISSLTERVLGTRLCTKPIHIIEQKYKTALAAYEKSRKEVGLIREKLAHFEEHVRKIKKKLSNFVCATGACKHGGDCSKIADMVSKLTGVLTSPPQDMRQFLNSKEFSDVKDNVDKALYRRRGYSQVAAKGIESLLREMANLVWKVLPIATEHRRLRAHRRPLYSVQISATKLCRAIQRERRWIISQLDLFRKEQPGQSELKGFLKRSHMLLDCARQLFRRRYLLDALGLPGSGDYIRDTASCRLEMSVHRIFDCGLNTLVLGDAGSGKTTTLQMYAKAKTLEGEKLCIYIALPSLISLPTHASESVDSEVEDKMTGCVAQYLSSVGCCVEKDELARLFRSGNVVLELDGIDEGIVGAPWLIGAVVRFSETYDATQIILSSRISGDFIDDLPFAAVTLLPFSDYQRDVFIRNWFGEDSTTNARNANQIISHLEKNVEMAEIVRNPLLATVMCALQEHGVPLPESEVRLYRARIELLLGLYDVYKGVKRLECHPQDLQDVAERIAFALHSRRIRHADPSEVIQIAEDYARSKSTRTRYRRAIKELQHPCEVLVPMTDSGRIGFGHLRYQEYFAARYLCVHRNEDLVPLGHDPWWREVFVLLAKMLPDSEWLVAALAERGFRACLDTIRAIICVYPSEERSRLIGVAHCFRDMEYMDLVSDEAARPAFYPGLDTEIAIEDLLSQGGSVRGKIHNISGDK